MEKKIFLKKNLRESVAALKKQISSLEKQVEALKFLHEHSSGWELSNRDSYNRKFYFIRYVSNYEIKELPLECDNGALYITRQGDKLLWEGLFHKIIEQGEFDIKKEKIIYFKEIVKEKETPSQIQNITFTIPKESFDCYAINNITDIDTTKGEP